VGKDDGLLMFDIGNDGKVTEAKEIAFAFFTENEDDTDLEALREVFDSNSDDVLNAQDEDWSQFKVWKDSNQNGIADEGELMTLDEVGITEIGLIVRDGTSEVLSDGTVNHGLIDVIMEDGSTVDGGDIAFAFDQNGEREVIDNNGNTVIEYEQGKASDNGGNVAFRFGDPNQLVHHLQAMGLVDTAMDLMPFIEQEGGNIVFKQDGVVRATLEETTIEEFVIAISKDTVEIPSVETDTDISIAIDAAEIPIAVAEQSADGEVQTQPTVIQEADEEMLGAANQDEALADNDAEETVLPEDSMATVDLDSELAPLIAYEGDMFEFIEEDAPDPDPDPSSLVESETALTAQAVADTNQLIVAQGSENPVDAGVDEGSNADTVEELITTINDDGA
jgi:hypothetical protein